MLSHKITDYNALAGGIVEWTKNAFSGFENAVLGISGGTDSTVVGKILVNALGPDHVWGIFMPNGVQKDISDAYAAAKATGITNTIECNLGLSVEAAKMTVKSVVPKHELTLQADTNIVPRVRTAVEMGIAQCIPNSLVVCTGNLSELMMGYFTMWADMGSIAPIANLTKTEVRQLGLALGLPENLVMKTPSDGLSGISDEEKMGFSYEVIDSFIRGDLENLSEGVRLALAERMKKMEFKRKMIRIPSYNPVFG